MPLVANIFNFTSLICEFILVITGKNEAAFGNVAIAKVLLLREVLSFVSNS